MLSDNAMCAIKAIKLGCGVTTLPAAIYDELARSGVICRSVPCLPYFQLTDAGETLVSDVFTEQEPGTTPYRYWRDTSRVCPVVERSAEPSVQPAQ